VSTATEMTAEEYNALAESQKGGRKYRNKPTTVDGIVFDSKAEARHYEQLRALERNGIIRDLLLQPRFPLLVNGEKIGTYVADFQYTDWDGNLTVVDVKGMKTPVYKLKKRLMKAVHGITVEEIG
jgi:hypothetical protein